jgi:protein transport protein SEC24
MYHALGETPQNPNSPRKQNEAPKFRPPVAPSPGGYQQVGSPINTAPPNQYIETPGSNTQGYAPSPQEPGYLPPQKSPTAANEGDMANLTSQMGGMGLGVDTTGHSKAHKKKDRHAYHNIEGPGAEWDRNTNSVSEPECASTRRGAMGQSSDHSSNVTIPCTGKHAL